MLIKEGKKYFSNVSGDFYIERGLNQIIFLDLFFSFCFM